MRLTAVEDMPWPLPKQTFVCQGPRVASIVALDEALLVDAPPDTITPAVSRDAVLQHGASHPGGAVGHDLLAHDVVLAPVLVRDPHVDADLSRTALDGAGLDLDGLERQQLLAIPHAADADVELIAQIDADRVE